MLKGIPNIISPELIKALMEMGHGDSIVIVDGNFPSESVGKNVVVVRADGHGIPELLEAVLKLMPFDIYVEQPVSLMQVVPGDDVKTPIWDEYKEIVKKYDARGEHAFTDIEMFSFYEEAKTAYTIVATGESAVYANIMLQKGVVKVCLK